MNQVSQSSHGYWGLMVETWDLLRGDTSTWADRTFYRQIIEAYGEPALDVGCSTGRLLIDYMEQGIDIDGVDLSAEMLALCRAKAQERELASNLYHQAMHELDLPRRYRTIVVSSSTFQLLTDRRQAQEALARFYHHLQPGGAVVMSFMIVWQEGEPLDSDWHLGREAIRPEDGATIRHWSRSHTDAVNQLQSAEDRYEVLIDGKIIRAETYVQSPEVRWYTQEQAVQLLQKAEFANVQVGDGFTQKPASAEATLFTLTGERPSG